HRDAPLARLAQHRRNARAIFDRDGNRIDAARDPALDQFVLARGLEASRAVPDEIDPKLACRLFGAGATTDEVRVTLGLRHHRDDRPRAGTRPDRAPRCLRSLTRERL